MGSSNILKRVIAQAYFDCIQYVYHKANNHKTEREIQVNYIYNMDEIVYDKKSRTKTVISVQVLRNIVKNQLMPHFISSFPPCCSAYHHVITPMFVLTVKILNIEVTDDFCFKFRTFTVSLKIFKNSNTLLQWIEHFENIITSSTKWPVVLILDGCASH